MILNTAMSEYLFVSAHANNSASLASVTLQCHVDYSHTWNAVTQTHGVQSPVCIPAPGDLATWRPGARHKQRVTEVVVCNRSDV